MLETKTADGAPVPSADRASANDPSLNRHGFVSCVHGQIALSIPSTNSMESVIGDLAKSLVDERFSQ